MVKGQKRSKPSESGSISVESLDPNNRSLAELFILRTQAIGDSIAETVLRNLEPIAATVEIFADCMANGGIVREVGAGRAKIAGLMGLNRAAHGGVQVSEMGGTIPMPHSSRKGVIVAFSASGETPPVLEAMEVGKANNPSIQVVGFARHDAEDFRQRCDAFVGLWTPKGPQRPSLSALADIEEWVMGELFDAIVVLAGQKLAYDDGMWRLGHEDIGPTGPYAPLRAQAGS